MSLSITSQNTVAIMIVNPSAAGDGASERGKRIFANLLGDFGDGNAFLYADADPLLRHQKAMAQARQAMTSGKRVLFVGAGGDGTHHWIANDVSQLDPAQTGYLPLRVSTAGDFPCMAGVPWDPYTKGPIAALNQRATEVGVPLFNFRGVTVSDEVIEIPSLLHGVGIGEGIDLWPRAEAQTLKERFPHLRSWRAWQPKIGVGLYFPPLFQDMIPRALDYERGVRNNNVSVDDPFFQAKAFPDTLRGLFARNRHIRHHAGPLKLETLIQTEIHFPFFQTVETSGQAVRMKTAWGHEINTALVEANKCINFKSLKERLLAEHAGADSLYFQRSLTQLETLLSNTGNNISSIPTDVFTQEAKKLSHVEELPVQPLAGLLISFSAKIAAFFRTGANSAEGRPAFIGIASEVKPLVSSLLDAGWQNAIRADFDNRPLPFRIHYVPPVMPHKIVLKPTQGTSSLKALYDGDGSLKKGPTGYDTFQEFKEIVITPGRTANVVAAKNSTLATCAGKYESNPAYEQMIVLARRKPGLTAGIALAGAALSAILFHGCSDETSTNQGRLRDTLSWNGLLHFLGN